MDGLLFSNLTPRPDDTICTSFGTIMKATDGTFKIDNMEPGEKMSIRKVEDKTFFYFIYPV